MQQMALGATVKVACPLICYRQLVARGKHKKQALIAVARKLLLVAHAVYRSEEPFREEGIREVTQEVIVA